jgi:inosose dehydratase
VPLSFATAPGAWGVEPPGSPLDPPWETVLDEVAAAGYDGIELGPLGFLPPQSVRLRPALAARKLRLAAGFVMAPFHQGVEAGLTDAVKRTCATIAGAGATTLVLIEALVPERATTAGRAHDAPRLDDDGWVRLTSSLERFAALAAHEHGLETVFHPHAGTVVEFADEVERLLAGTDPELVGLCLDTGHAVYGGIDPASLCRAHGTRIGHVHVKDVDADRLGRAISSGSSFQQAVADGVFCPLGRGAIDLAAVADALRASAYDGWVVFEQDRRPGVTPAAYADAVTSLEHLHDAGFDAGRPVADAR